MKFVSASAFFGAFLLTGAAVQAATLTADQILNQFNLVVLGNHVASSQTHGRAFVGGSVSGSGQFGTGNYTLPQSSFGQLTVGGDVTGNINVKAGSTLDVGGKITGHVDLPNGTIKQSVPGLDVVANHFATTLKQASQDIRGLTSNSEVSKFNNGQGVQFVGLAGRLTIFDVGISDLLGSELNITLNGATAILINFAGKNISLSRNFNTLESVGANVIWNFFEAETLHIDNLFVGSVLAPLATVSNGNNIHGTLVAGAFNQGGQIHQQAWAGGIPRLDPVDTPVPVPLPAAGWLLLAGLGGLAALRRRAA